MALVDVEMMYELLIPDIGEFLLVGDGQILEEETYTRTILSDLLDKQVEFKEPVLGKVYTKKVKMYPVKSKQTRKMNALTYALERVDTGKIILLTGTAKKEEKEQVKQEFKKFFAI